MRILVCGGRNFGKLPASKPPHEVRPGVYCAVDKNHPDYPARMAEYDLVRKKLYEITAPYDYPPDEYGNTLPNVTIIHGGATGADTVADEWATVNWTGLKVFPAEWDDLSHPDAVIRTRWDGTKYDAKAGSRRNQKMLDEGKPDLVVAFPGGTGTADMVRRAEKARVRVINVTE